MWRAPPTRPPSTSRVFLARKPVAIQKKPKGQCGPTNQSSGLSRTATRQIAMKNSDEAGEVSRKENRTNLLSHDTSTACRRCAALPLRVSVNSAYELCFRWDRHQLSSTKIGVRGGLPPRHSLCLGPYTPLAGTEIPQGRFTGNSGSEKRELVHFSTVKSFFGTDYSP